MNNKPEISYRPCADLLWSAQLTYKNMQPFYRQHGVEWDQQKILEQITPLQNFDILQDGVVVGAMRLSTDSTCLMVRDLQVCDSCQNQGIGALALSEAARVATEAQLNSLQLKVFRISPAHRLYLRCGFDITDTDDKFYYMAKTL